MGWIDKKVSNEISVKMVYTVSRIDKHRLIYDDPGYIILLSITWSIRYLTFFVETLTILLLSDSDNIDAPSHINLCLFKYKKGKVFNNLNDAYHYFSKFINNNDLLMIKGSNATGLNQFSKNIKRI